MQPPEQHMTATHAPAPSAPGDGFEVLDACHRQTLETLRLLDTLAARLTRSAPDAQTRAMAADVINFFSTVARQHHEDEERHIFPPLLAQGDADIVQAVSRLQQDHHWLDVDWRELAPQLDAVAAGQAWYDLDAMREGIEIFVGLSHDHIELEESLIYPNARLRLGMVERREMAREMAARRHARIGDG
jgi:hemerythrin-like domain-containing protein